MIKTCKKRCLYIVEVRTRYVNMNRFMFVHKTEMKRNEMNKINKIISYRNKNRNVFTISITAFWMVVVVVVVFCLHAGFFFIHSVLCFKPRCYRFAFDWFKCARIQNMTQWTIDIWHTCTFYHTILTDMLLMLWSHFNLEQ